MTGQTRRRGLLTRRGGPGEREKGEASRQDDSSRGGRQAGRCRHTSRHRA